MDPNKKYDAGAEAQKRLMSMATAAQQSAKPWTPSASQAKGSNNPESGKFKTAVKNFLNPSVNIKGESKMKPTAMDVQGKTRTRTDSGNKVNEKTYTDFASERGYTPTNREVKKYKKRVKKGKI